MRGWQRDMRFEHTGLPWVMPSPNMPTVDTALVYPGMCLVEGTELSEARGTTRPFELAGAPYIDGYRLADRPRPRWICRASRFGRRSSRRRSRSTQASACGGVQLHVTNPTRSARIARASRSSRRATTSRRTSSSGATKAYEFVDKIPAIDLLAGTDALRKGIEAGASLDDLARALAARRG